MSTASMHDPLQLSENARFKAQYGRTIRWSILIAVVLVIVGALLTPNYIPNPYKLRQEEFEVVDLQDQQALDIPPPPIEAPAPPKVIEAAPDDEVSDDVDIADTLMDIDTALASGMSTGPVGDEGFVASSENPKILVWAKPDYPEMARRAQLEGTVLVKVLVGPDGSVRDAIVINGVNPLLNKAALDAARRCKFSPGKQRNIPVKAWMALPFSFRLN